MPCHNTCEQRLLLEIKESRVAKLLQIEKWLDELVLREPQRAEEVRIKKQITRANANKTLNESRRLIRILARGCDLCNREE